MPITGPASYLPTTDQFIAHWTSANAELGGAAPIILGGGVAVAGLATLRSTLEGQRAEVAVARNDVEFSRATL
ncbi:MAG: hypothetical protein H7Y36_10300, partial [Armatimonadetes bacterium]|nr:hypothetical protein [Akkermansiaceae bacterium]